MTVDAQLRVGGTWLASAGLSYAGLEWTDRADGGNFECTWDMAVAYAERPEPLVKGAAVEVYVGASRRWYGELTDTDWDGGSFTATGMSQRAYDFAARTTAGLKSTVPDSVIATAALIDGWNITQLKSFGTTAVVAGDTDGLVTVGAVLDASAEQTGRRWGVGGDGILRAYNDPTFYDYLLAPGVIELGETTEDTFTKIIFQYLDSSTGQLTLDGVDTGRLPTRHNLQDYTSKGPISNAVAATIASNQLRVGASSPGWTSAATVASAQLLTPGGLPADLASVTAGQMVRAVVVGDNGQSYRDLVIGETKYAAGDDVLSLSPAGKVATTLSEVLEDTYARLTGTPVTA